MYTSKITDKKDSYTQNANFITHEIGHFNKSAKMYTRKNIYVHSISLRILHVIVRNIVFEISSKAQIMLCPLLSNILGILRPAWVPYMEIFKIYVGLTELMLFHV